MPAGYSQFLLLCISVKGNDQTPLLPMPVCVSILTTNAEKSLALLEAIRDQVQLVPTDAHDIAKHNGLKFSEQLIHLKICSGFFSELKAHGWTTAERSVFSV